MTPEAKVKKRVKAQLAEFSPIYYVMPFTGGYGNSGAPDFLACIQGKFYGIEVKSGDEEPTALQWKNLSQIECCGGFTFVVRESNVDQLADQIRATLRGIASHECT